MEVNYVFQALADIASIAQFLTGFLDQETVNEQLYKIEVDIDRIANLPLLKGKVVRKVDPILRMWLIADDQYWVYFTKDEDQFEVLRIWSSKCRRLKYNQIRP